MIYAPGQRVGDYLITGVVGQGAAGQVFRVQHAVTGRLEAMKVLLAERGIDQAMRERFLQEIKIQATLNHPNITAVHNAFCHEDDLILIMELVDGQ